MPVSDTRSHSHLILKALIEAGENLTCTYTVGKPMKYGGVDCQVGDAIVPCGKHDVQLIETGYIVPHIAPKKAVPKKNGKGVVTHGT